MSRKKINIIFLTLSGAGYIWLYLNFTHFFASQSKFTVCLFKNVTGIPCPSCGITRSILSLAHGNIQEAFYLNPLGIIVFGAIIIIPVWIITDLLIQKNSFGLFYKSMEKTFQKRWVAIAAIIGILLIWFNNINQHL